MTQHLPSNPALSSLLMQRLHTRLRLDYGLGCNYISKKDYEHLLSLASSLSSEAHFHNHSLSFSPTLSTPPTSSLLSTPSLAPSNLESLRLDCINCRNCILHTKRRQVVLGEGNLDSKLMFIGEAPGREEDEEGKPFIGNVGKLLTDIIEKGLKIPREQVYITNIIKCRPPGNRAPRPEEINMCQRFIKYEISMIRPKILIALGKIAGNYLTQQEGDVSDLRGRWYTYESIPLRVLYHPAYLLRRRREVNGKTLEDQETWSDLKAIIAKH